MGNKQTGMSSSIGNDTKITSATEIKRKQVPNALAFLEDVSFFDMDDDEISYENVSINNAIKAVQIAEIKTLEWALTETHDEIKKRYSQLLNKF